MAFPNVPIVCISAYQYSINGANITTMTMTSLTKDNYSPMLRVVDVILSLFNLLYLWVTPFLEMLRLLGLHVRKIIFKAMSTSQSLLKIGY